MGAVRINGSTSGYVELAAPAVAGSVVMTLPATTGTLAVQGYAYGQSATATVATAQTTTSASFTDLATVGPSVTLTTGTKALVIVSSLGGADTVNRSVHHGYAVSGATTVAASSSTSHQSHNNVGSPQNQDQDSFVSLLTGLTAGSNTFTSKYLVSGAGTGQFSNRNITVMDMGS